MAQKKWMHANNANSPLLNEIIDLYRHDEVSPFWQKSGAESGYYTDLNNIRIPSDSTIAAYQLKKIEEFQNAALNNKDKKYVNDLNKLFLTGNINFASNFEKDEKMKINEEITKLVKTVNETYGATPSKNNPNYNYNFLQQKLLELQNQLEMLQRKLSISNNGVYGNDLKLISNAINACGLKDLSNGAIQEWYKHINSIKGELVEEIGNAWLGKIEMPQANTISINTGSLHLNTNRAERHSGQLIQDLMVLNVDGVDLEAIPVEYKIKTENGGKMIKTTLKGLLDKMQSHSGESTKIVIPDSTYDVLLQYSALNIQAKAGLNQTPWNKNKSTEISISEFKEEAKLNGVGVKRIFMLLHSLKLEPVPNGHRVWVKQYSSDGDYNAIANYGLATILSKILHLSDKMESNQFLLTPSGFTTYTERIGYLMKRHKTAITISSSVAISGDTLTHRYNAQIPTNNT